MKFGDKSNWKIILSGNLKKTKKYKAHDETNSKKVGDTVEIEETRPISKDKKFKVIA